MKLPALTILALLSIWAVGEMSYQDELRQEQAHCESGLELAFDMPEYCDKYLKSGEMK